jgi:hypothetical protein
VVVTVKHAQPTHAAVPKGVHVLRLVVRLFG